MPSRYKRSGAFCAFALLNYYVAVRLLLRTQVGAVIFSAILLCCLLSVLQVAATDPGLPDGDDGGSCTRFCTLCSNAKPARTHHCRVCNRCVLRMDHHCTWLDSCIGQKNYKPYFLALYYAWLSSLVVLLLLWGGYISGVLVADVSPWIQAALVLDAAALGLLHSSCAYLLCWHAFLLSKNATTIEYYQIQRSLRDPMRADEALGYMYNEGTYRNIRAVLGDNMALWLVPTVPDFGRNTAAAILGFWRRCRGVSSGVVAGSGSGSGGAGSESACGGCCMALEAGLRSRSDVEMLPMALDDKTVAQN